jgi:hypothetical protein
VVFTLERKNGIKNIKEQKKGKKGGKKKEIKLTK